MPPFPIFLKSSRIIGLMALCFLILSYANRWFWPLDVLAIGRPFFWFLLTLFVFFLPKPVRFIGFIAILLGLWDFKDLLVKPTPVETPAFRLYQHNLFYQNQAPDLDLVTRQLEPDVLTLQEIKKSKNRIDTLKAYPYAQYCGIDDIGLVAVVSRQPFLESGCSNTQGRQFAWGRVRVGKSALTIVSWHLYWPYPYAQPEQIMAYWKELEKLPKPIVIAGDFNQMAWSRTLRETANQIEGKIVPGLRFTLLGRHSFYTLPIDHIISPNGVGHVRVLDRYGSDHNALLFEM